jgi:DmsE family decaheme c-type cytochrome
LPPVGGFASKKEALMRRTMFVLALAAVLVLFGGDHAFAQAGAAAATWSATDCQACHEATVVAAFARSKHATLDQSCAQCHPLVAEHVKAKLAGDATAPSPTLTKLSASQLNEKCLSCHEKANQANYLSSMHARRNVACISCHSVHSFKSAKAQLKTRMDTDTCFTCHKSERAKSMRTSHHPVREGKMSCASCHNPHDGAAPKMLKNDSVNELCYSCHTEKRGPFLFEHAPVREDCVSCHEPHGTNHSRLLIQKLPTLCWNCHLTGSGHFGSGDNLTTEKGATIAPPGAPTGYPVRGSRTIERSCRMCHVQLHGSNHPSGAYFVR